MQISLRRQAPPNIGPYKNKPLKKGLWQINISPGAYFQNFMASLVAISHGIIFFLAFQQK